MPQQTVVIAGGHGKIAHHLITLLADRGDTAVALIRNPDHADEITEWGGRPRVLDLENSTVEEVAAALSGATAAVFAAGAGPGSSVERKDSVDRGAAVLLAQGAEVAGVQRFVQISSFGAGDPIKEGADETWVAYLKAKTAAEDDLRTRSGLDWTILRPGGLTDETAAGLVTLTDPPLERGTVTRADVAAVVAALLDAPASVHRTLMLTEGPTALAQAVAGL